MRIKIGVFTFRKILISDFEDAEVGVTVGGENWTNTIHMHTIRKKGVTLYKRSGLFRRLNITPDEPADFVERIKTHPLFQPHK